MAILSGGLDSKIRERIVQEQQALDNAFSDYERQSHVLSSSGREQCLLGISFLAKRLLTDLSRYGGMPKTDLEHMTATIKARLFKLQDNRADEMLSSRFAKMSLASLDRDIGDLRPPSPSHHSDHVTTKSIIDEALRGVMSHEVVGELLGEKAGILFELTVGTLAHEPHPSSKNPTRDSILSAASHISVIEAGGLVIKGAEWEAYAAAAGLHAVGKTAQVLEEKIDAVQKTTAPENPVVVRACLGEEGCVTPGQAIASIKMLCKGAQLPSKAIHEAHHALTESAKKALDTAGITEENISKLAKEYVTMSAKQAEMGGWAETPRAADKEGL